MTRSCTWAGGCPQSIVYARRCHGRDTGLAAETSENTLGLILRYPPPAKRSVFFSFHNECFMAAQHEEGCYEK